jgi:hypothetical protein
MHLLWYLNEMYKVNDINKSRYMHAVPFSFSNSSLFMRYLKNYMYKNYPERLSL